MLPLSLWLKLVHVVIAFGFTAGLVGRTFAYRQAKQSSELRELSLAITLAERFDSLLVIPGGFGILLSGLLTMWSEQLPLLAPGYLWLSISLGIVLLNFALVPLVFLPRRKRFRAAFAEARQRAALSPELGAALADPTLRLARTFESIGLFIVVALMVLKPF
ncbi:MAG TPA: DUF2269 family protein [Polyangiaceae bacterium]|jgi:uncharacterized membrane protein|nr:DUF2269 family protein [Polyangiaceae bacterium]